MPAGLTIQLVGSGHSTRPRGYTVPRRTLPALLLEWADAGGWEVELDGGATLQAPAPRVLVVAQEHAHALRTVHSACMTRYLLLRVEMHGMPLLTDPTLSGVLDLPLSQRIHACSERVLQAQDTLLQAVQATGAMHDLVGILLTQAATPQPLPRSPGRLQEVLTRMEANLAEPLSRADLARWAGLSPTRFHAVFQADLGLAPMAYLRALRLRRARELLASSRLPVHRIASQCGFPSVYHFSRLFRRHQGCTASAYRAASHDA